MTEKYTPDQPKVPGADVIYRPAGEAGEYAPLATNPYKGCGHKCAYCLHPDTPIQMADGTACRIADLNVGDDLIGVQKRDEVRRAWNYKFVTSKVLNKIKTVNKPVYHVTLDNGASVICSSDHRWLTERGWKFTSMLTMNNQVRTFSGPTRPTPNVTGSYRIGYLAGMIRGDATLKRYDYSGRYTRATRSSAQKTDVQHHFRLALADTDALDRAAEYLTYVGIETHRFEFAEAVGVQRPMQAIRNHTIEAFDKLSDLVYDVRSSDPEWVRGWLAGIFDAEGGTATGVLRVHNTDAAILDITDSGLRTFGFRTIRDIANQNGCSAVRMLGGLSETARFFNITGPAIARKFPAVGQRLRGSSQVASISLLKQSAELIDITTSTENFIANGLVSHNCYVPLATHQPRPDFDAGAVPRQYFMGRLIDDCKRYKKAGVRDQVMLSFATDPYHPGNTQLTRHVLHCLADYDLGFCTLTKGGTKSLRDLEVFRPKRDAFAATLTTLDDSFSRKWERGAPLPADRIKALQTFHERGIFTWVSLEPTLDAQASLDLVQATHGFVDLYKIGRANYLKEITRTTNWQEYTLRMIDLCQRLGVKHYIKRSLQEWLPANYPNPLRVAQHH